MLPLIDNDRVRWIRYIYWEQDHNAKKYIYLMHRVCIWNSNNESKTTLKNILYVIFIKFGMPMYICEVSTLRARFYEVFH